MREALRGIDWKRLGQVTFAGIAFLIVVNSWRYHHDLCDSIRRDSHIWLRIHLLVGTDVDGLGADGCTPLACALRYKDHTALALLLRHKANPNVAQAGGTYQGCVPLQIAVELGDAEGITALLESGADPNAPDAVTGGTTLHRAHEVEVARQLIDAGADPNAVDSLGRTPLMLRVRDGDRKAVRLLLQRGADPTIADSAGSTAADIAEMAGRPELYRQLCGAVAQWDRVHNPVLPPPEPASESGAESAATESATP
jgi:ankyrin repeat protein